MKSHKHKEHYYFNKEDWPLLQLSHSFAQASVWLAEGMHKHVATFELTVREMPKRNYLMMCGLEEILNYLLDLRFTPDHIKHLKQLELVSPACAKYLEKFRFTGTVHAMPEGTPFFPGEPIVRITAPIIEASLIEQVLMTILTGNIPFLSKIARVKIATQGKFRISGGPMRNQSFEAGWKSARASYLVGILGVAIPAVTKKFNLPSPKMTAVGQHFYIKSFPTELAAMQAMAEHFSDNVGFMLDTYDMKAGVEKALGVARGLEAQGKRLVGVTVDSGDLDYWTRYVKDKFQKAGLKAPDVFVATNLDEHKVLELARKDTPCDCAIVATEYNTVSDAPKLEVVYKVAEIRDGRKVRHTAKLTPGKTSLPGRKQVYRIYDKNGKMKKDVIGLEGEKLGHPLLKKVMHQGRLLKRHPSLEELQHYTLDQLKKIPARLHELEEEVRHPVIVSRKVKDLLKKVIKEHTNK